MEKTPISSFTKPKKKMMTVPVFTTAQKWTVRFNTVNQVNVHRSGWVLSWKKEMRYLNDILHGMEPTEEFVKLLTGETARAAIATADACTRSRYENRKVDLSEIIGK